MVRPREGEGGGLALGASPGAARGSRGGRLHGQSKDLVKIMEKFDKMVEDEVELF